MIIILVNSAADVLCSRLAEFYGPDELFRLNWWQRPLSAVPLPLLKYCYRPQNSSFDIPLKKMNSFKIVVSTSVAAGVLETTMRASRNSPLTMQFDLVVIDEVSQATEGESLVPISLVKPAGVIVLSGDPEQLGPVPRSPVFQAAGMHLSLQERLLQHDIYENIRPYFSDGQYNVRMEKFCKFGVYLRHNYRSQVSILRQIVLSLALFYFCSEKHICSQKNTIP